MASPNPTSSLPPEVIPCLQNTRFVRPSKPAPHAARLTRAHPQLHLATSSQNTPHISLMNYTYLPHTPYRPYPTIILTTPPAASSRKTANLAANPAVSLLVHDWVSHRPPTLSSSPETTTTPAPRSASSLAALLLGINSAALSRISVTLNGRAEILEQGGEEAGWCKARHVENNTFEGAGVGSGIFGTVGEAGDGDGDGGAGCYIEGKGVRVVVVRIMNGRISDWKGRVEDWVVAGAEAGDGYGMEGHLVNGT